MGIARAALLAITIAWLMSGCATTRSTIDVSVIKTQQVPLKGFAKVLEVKDVRRFEATPGDPSIPSLQNSEEINDRAITFRAVARKRGGYGMAFAEILLPEGRTVEQIVREAATKALAEKGYAVVAEGSPEFAQALPVNMRFSSFGRGLRRGSS